MSGTTESPLHLAEPRSSLLRTIRPSDGDVRRARRRLHAKAAAIAALAIVSYWGLVLSSVGWVGRIGYAAMLVVAVVAIGTGIMHDANHGAFSRSRRTNRVVSYSADLLGA